MRCRPRSGKDMSGRFGGLRQWAVLTLEVFILCKRIRIDIRWERSPAQMLATCVSLLLAGSTHPGVGRCSLCWLRPQAAAEELAVKTEHSSRDDSAMAIQVALCSYATGNSRRIMSIVGRGAEDKWPLQRVGFHAKASLIEHTQCLDTKNYKLRIYFVVLFNAGLASGSKGLFGDLVICRL